MKKTIMALFAAFIMTAAALLLPVAECSIPAAAAVSVKTSVREVTLYGLNSDYDEYISVPKNKASYKIKIKAVSKITYQVTSGKSVTVSSTGVVKPSYETWYWYGGVGTTSDSMYGGRKPDRIQKRTVTGDSVVTAKFGKQTYKIKFHVRDYSDIYADRKMDEYIEKHVTSDMTDRQKLEAACRYAASYDYSPYASDRVSMTITGGGDCWASTDMIIAFLDKLDIPAQARDGRSDPGAGSGHMNVLAEAGGDHYILEAGYNGKAPRKYDIRKAAG